MRLRAMAKINLGLDILGKREDGYHEVRMLMQTRTFHQATQVYSGGSRNGRRQFRCSSGVCWCQ